MNNKRLIGLLVEETDLDREAAEKQLNQFTGQVLAGVRKNGSLRVEGLGKFRLVDGTLTFKAGENLATEINHKYAGMKPIELMGAFKNTADTAKPAEGGIPDAAETVFGIEEYSEKASPEDEPVEKVSAKTGAGKRKEKPEAQFSKPEAPEEPAAVEAEERVAENEESKNKNEEEAVVAARSGVGKTKKEGESQDPIGKILVAAVILIALGVSGWLYYDMNFSGAGNSSMMSGNQSTGSLKVAQSEAGSADGRPLSDSGKAAGADSVSGRSSSKENSSEQNKSKSISNTTSIAEQSRQSVYGLRGGAAPRMENGYTIVVHSLRSEARVRKLNQEFQKEGYRTIISSAGVMDTTFWRLGLGQFKTIQDAMEAASTLPDPYKSNHFIKRIQQ